MQDRRSTKLCRPFSTFWSSHGGWGFASLGKHCSFNYVTNKPVLGLQSSDSPSLFLFLVGFRSLALEGIDSARQWPSMSDNGPEKPKKSGLGLSQKATVKAAATSGSGDRAPSSSGHISALYYSTPTTRSSRVKDSITKDSAPRKWICQAVPFATLGGEMMLPLWIPSKCSSWDCIG